MKAVPIGEVSAADWDRVCETSSSAWLFHRTAWIEIESAFQGHRSLSFALVDGSNLVGVHPLYVSECGLGWIERLIHSGIHRHTGLAVVDGLGPQHVRAAQTIAAQRIMAIAEAEQADRIQLNAQNLAPANMTSERPEIPFWVQEHGFHLGLQFGANGMLPAPGMSTCCADQIVSLAGSEETLFGALSDSGRRAVRKAVAAGLEFEVGTDERCVEEYYAIAQLGAERTGETLAPAEYYQTIWRRFATEGRCAVFFARHQSRRVAALFLVIDKGSASFLGGVSDPALLAMRVNDFLHWSAIVWASTAGLAHYRLGPAFPEVPADWSIARVSRFKTKFGGRSVTTIQGSYFLRPEKYLQGALEQLTRICSLPAARLPDSQ
jgi:hypothetical protein